MSDFYGLPMKEFVFDGQKASVVLPEEPNGKLVIKTQYFLSFPEVGIELVKNGFTFANVINTNRWGSEDNLERQAAFIKHVASEYNLSPKAAVIGCSLGGMQAVYLAANHPECVSVLYLDAPVMNFCSCPAYMGGVVGDPQIWDEFYKFRGITRSELLNYRNHPVDKLPQLKENNIPVVMVYGDSDIVVPYAENGLELERFYKENELCIQVFGKAGCGHHPHGLEDPKPIVDFIMEHAK